jgi:hypothetical protein
MAVGIGEIQTTFLFIWARIAGSDL